MWNGIRTAGSDSRLNHSLSPSVRFPFSFPHHRCSTFFCLLSVSLYSFPHLYPFFCLLSVLPLLRLPLCSLPSAPSPVAPFPLPSSPRTSPQRRSSTQSAAVSLFSPAFPIPSHLRNGLSPVICHCRKMIYFHCHGHTSDCRA